MWFLETEDSVARPDVFTCDQFYPIVLQSEVLRHVQFSMERVLDVAIHGRSGLPTSMSFKHSGGDAKICRRSCPTGSEAVGAKFGVVQANVSETRVDQVSYGCIGNMAISASKTVLPISVFVNATKDEPGVRFGNGSTV